MLESIRLLPGLLGLAMSYALGVTGVLNGLLQSFTETEKELVAVERIHHYTTTVPRISKFVYKVWKLDGIFF